MSKKDLEQKDKVRKPSDEKQVAILKNYLGQSPMRVDKDRMKSSKSYY